MVKTDLINNNLIDTLKKYVKDNGFWSEYELIYRWGIDFACCCVKSAEKNIDSIILMAFDNRDGTSTIEKTQFTDKYLKIAQAV